MNKQGLLTFIKKYNLSGLVESVSWKIKDKKLSTKFILDDQTLLGKVTFNEFDYEDIELGISETSKFIKMLSVLDDDFDFAVSKVGDKAKTILMKDNNSNIKYILSNLDLINTRIPKPTNLGEPHIKIKMTSDFISKFIKAKASFEKCESFYITADELINECRVVLTEGGADSIEEHSSVEINNTISINVNTEYLSDVNKVSVNASLFKDIIDVNRDFTQCTFDVYKQGLIHLSFDNGIYQSDYYLVSIQ